MSARRKTAGRKSGTSRKSSSAGARKKPARKKAVTKKSAAKKPAAGRRSAAAPKRKLELVHRSGAGSASSPSRPSPKLGVVKGGKAASDRERRQAQMDEAMAEDVARLPKAAEASAPSRSFKQTDFANSKQMVLFRMARARTSVLAALQGIQPGAAERALGDERWTVRQMVLHLGYWDLRLTEAVEPAVAGVPPEWLRYEKQDFDRLNAEAIERLAHMSWDEALRHLHAARQELLAAIESIPDEPMHVWGEEHALGGMLHWVAPHDLHHADIVKRWRAEEGV